MVANEELCLCAESHWILLTDFVSEPVYFEALMSPKHGLRCLHMIPWRLTKTSVREIGISARTDRLRQNSTKNAYNQASRRGGRGDYRIESKLNMLLPNMAINVWLRVQ